MVIVTPSRIGVRASPAARSAEVSMKNSSMPMLKVKLMRRNGIASSRTSGEALAKSSRNGDAEVADRRHHRVHRDRGQQRLLNGAIDLLGIAGADDSAPPARPGP